MRQSTITHHHAHPPPPATASHDGGRAALLPKKEKPLAALHRCVLLYVQFVQCVSVVRTPPSPPCCGSGPSPVSSSLFLAMVLQFLEVLCSERQIRLLKYRRSRVLPHPLCSLKRRPRRGQDRLSGSQIEPIRYCLFQFFYFLVIYRLFYHRIAFLRIFVAFTFVSTAQSAQPLALAIFTPLVIHSIRHARARSGRQQPPPTARYIINFDL